MKIDIDALAQQIRTIDGSHNMGAGALAEALEPYLSSLMHQHHAVMPRAVGVDRMELAAPSPEIKPSAYSVKREGDGHTVVQEDVGTICYCFADDGGVEARKIATLLTGSTKQADVVAQLVGEVGTAIKLLRMEAHPHPSPCADALEMKARPLIAVIQEGSVVG
ncbi:MAG: hypothetical protein ACRER5_02970 [Pseudomonas sp.]